MRVIVAIGLAAVSLTLASCESFYGLSTWTELPAQPDVACVDTALRGVEGLTRVDHQQGEHSTREVFPHPGMTRIVSDVWVYEAGPTGGLLQILNSGGYVTYQNGRTQMNARFPPGDLEAYAPVMARVNEAMQRSCGIDLSDAGGIGRR